MTQWLNLEVNTSRRAKTAMKIFEEKQLKKEDPITRYVFDQIINEHQTHLFVFKSTQEKPQMPQ
jgi:hypothetical protein